MIRRAAVTIAAILSILAIPLMSATSNGVVAQDDDIKIAYVLHGLNAFTEVIKEGAEDAAEDLGVELEVFGQAGFDVPTHQAFFESAMQSGVDGIVVVPNGGDQWNSLLESAADEGIALAASNTTALTSVLDLWVGQDEYTSGVILGEEIKKFLGDKGVTSGQIVAGSCIAGLQVLIDRYNGLAKALEGTEYELSENYDVKVDNTENYNQWDNLATANPDSVAMVGLCSLDIANLAQIKERGSYEWMVAGYDLDVPTLEAMQNGFADVTVGQQPYLQGYLPVLALVQELRDGNKITGWLETPTEVVTAANVADYTDREGDNAVQREFYQTYIAENFSDLQAAARPYDDLKTPGMPRATPEGTPEA